MSNRLNKFLLPFSIFALATFALPADASKEFSKDASKEVSEIVDNAGLAGSFLAARIASVDNDDIAAVGFFKRTLELDPDNNQVKRDLFNAYLAGGKIEEAVLLSRDISTKNTNGFIIAMVNGVELIRKRSWAKAIDTLSAASGSDLDGLIVDILGAWAKFGNGELDAALKQIDDVSGAEWMDVLKNLHRGLMLSASGNDAAAVPILQKAVDTRSAARFLTETYINAIDALARAQQRLGNPEKAAAALTVGLNIFPNRPALLAMKSALDENKPAGLLISSPQQGAAELFYNLGNAIGREGGTPFAQIYLQLAGYLFPDSAPISISLASVFERQNKPERANAYYSQVTPDSPYKRRAQLETAINLNSLEDIDGAIVILNELIDANPADLVPYMTLGRLLNQHERFREAADIFDKAIARISNPKRQHWDFFYRRAISYERLKEWDKAEPSFRKALQLDPNRAVVLNYLGYSWVDKGINLDEGLDMIKKAVELRPDAGFIIDSLGWAYYRLKRYDEAVTELEKAISLLPQDPVINDHLGDAYWRVGRKLEAKFQWQHALNAEPEPEDEVKIRKKLETGLPDEPDNPVAKSE